MWQRCVCVSVEKISGEDEGGGRKIVEARSCQEGWSEVITHGHIEEDPSGGASAHHSLLLEVLENRFAGELIMCGKNRGHV